MIEIDWSKLYSLKPVWDREDGHRPFIFKSPNYLLADAPWTVRYGDDGALTFKTCKAATAFVKMHAAELVRGISPITGEVK